jgi:signal transduction histidine kinase
MHRGRLPARLKDDLIPGVALTLGAAALIEVLARLVLRPPSLTILLTVVAFVAYRSGVRVGMLSAAIVTLYGLYFLAPARHQLPFTSSAALQMALLAIAAFVIALLMGMLRRSARSSERQLRASEAKLRLILGQLPAHLWTTDRELCVTSVMGTGLARTQLDTQRFVGQPLSKIVQAGKIGRTVLEAHEQALHGKTASYERSIDGRILSCAIEPLRDAEGCIVGCLGLAHDITARIQTERQLAEERLEAARLAELDHLRREFIASVSHDLRTPLTSTRAGVGMVETSAGERLTPDELRLLRNARRNMERLDRHIADLLALNQIEAGALQLEREPLDLRAVVADALTTVEDLSYAKEQTIRLDLPEPLPVYGDTWRLEQVLTNLLRNAQQHTPLHTYIQVRGHAEQGRVCLSVQDSGPGIPAEDLDKVFHHHRRLDPTADGFGLGLAIARGIVELHEGQIWLESTPGVGTTVQLSLPLWKAQPAQPRDSRLHGEGEQGALKLDEKSAWA